MSVTAYGETMTMDGMQWQAVVTYDLAVTATTNTLSNIALKIRRKGTATTATSAYATLRIGYTKTGASLVYQQATPNMKLILAAASATSGETQSSWVNGDVASADNSVTVNTANGQQLYISIDIGNSIAMMLKLYGSGTTYTDNIDTVLDHHVNSVAELTYFSKPQITAISAVRCDAQGVDDDTGTYARISAVWSVDSTAPSNTGTVTGTITPQGGTASALTISSGGSGVSGTATALASGLDADTQYTVTITVTDLIGTTSRNVIITRAFFIMDFKAGGQGIGIGRAAPASGLEVGYEATFDADVLMREDLTVTGVLAVHGTLDMATPIPATSGGTGIADFGDTQRIVGSTVSVSHGSYGVLASIDLQPGVYLVIITVYAQNNSTGYRSWTWTADDSISAQKFPGTYGMAAANAAIYSSFCLRQSVETVDTYHVFGWQNSGNALNMRCIIDAVKIG